MTAVLLLSNHCYHRLYGDFHAAEDCTQEVMLLSLYRKANTLDMTKDILLWLYFVAAKEIKTDQRKKVYTVDIDTILEQPSENPFESSVPDVLNEEELKLIEEYLSGANKVKLARKKNLTLTALYNRTLHFKEKILEGLDENNKFKIK